MLFFTKEYVGNIVLFLKQNDIKNLLQYVTSAFGFNKCSKFSGVSNLILNYCELILFVYEWETEIFNTNLHLMM